MAALELRERLDPREDCGIRIGSRLCIRRDDLSLAEHPRHPRPAAAANAEQQRRDQVRLELRGPPLQRASVDLDLLITTAVIIGPAMLMLLRIVGIATVTPRRLRRVEDLIARCHGPTTRSPRQP